MRVFNEQQRFTQLWMLVLMGVSVVVPVGLIIKEYTSQKATMSTNEFIITITSILFVSSLIFFFKLITRIDEYGIHYRFFPFHRNLKTISWSQISKAYIRTYEPIGDYGGWGIKGGWSQKKGKAINVSGNVGIQLELTNGKKLLIGTNKEIEAKKVIETYQIKLNTHENI